MKSVNKFFISHTEWEMIAGAIGYFAEDVFEFDDVDLDEPLRSALSSANAKLKGMCIPQNDGNILPFTALEYVAADYSLHYIQEQHENGDLLEDLVPSSLCDSNLLSSLIHRLEAVLPDLGVRLV